MLKVTMILDNHIASPMKPEEFVSHYYLSPIAKEDLKDIRVEQGDNFGGVEKVYLSRKNLQTLLSKLDRKKRGDYTHCTLVKCDTVHPKYSQTMKEIAITAVEDKDYYADRNPGVVHPKDE